MGANKSNTNQRSGIQCVEVLISKDYVSDYRDNIHWTLSVYSLENQPVKKGRDVNNFEIYHFMVYDWKRTIKQLLDGRQIPYSIIQHFAAANVYPEIASGETRNDNEAALVNALGKVAAPANVSHPLENLLADEMASGRM